MDCIVNNDNIKAEEVCRTCLTDDGPFFNITDTFDHYTLTQMIQNITNLQMKPLDGYTQSICFQCVKELRNANKFRIKCLESNDSLVKLDTKTLEVAVNVCETKIPSVENIKKESEEYCDIVEISCEVSDCHLETEDDCKSEAPDPDVESDCENDENICLKTKDKDSKNKFFVGSAIIFDCPLCHGLFFSDIIYRKHIKDVHSDRLEDECFKQKREPLGFISREKRLNEITCIYKCAIDDFVGKTFVEFNNHMKEHLGEKPIICVECGFRTTKMTLLKTHRLRKHVNADEKRFSCSICNYSCKTKTAQKNHDATHTGEKNYQCKLCPMTFRHPSMLSAHKKVKHENKRPHVCSVCQKAFYRKEGLKYHMRSHTGERPFVCQYCGQGFMRESSARAHETLRHEPIKTLFKCDMCDYTTKRKAELKFHFMKHNGEKPFKCPQCPFSCSKKYPMKLHIWRHSGNKSFKCDLCDYKGYTSNSIKRHRIIHTGEKSFPCTMCDYRGSTNNALKTHMQTHDTEQKFECPNCPYKTNVRKNLGKHIKKSCVIKKKGRHSTKHPDVPDNILINNEIEEDSEEGFGALSIQT